MADGVSKKKVLMVSCDDLGNGGVQNVIMNIVRALKEQYTFDIILFLSEESYFDKEFLSYGGEIFRIPHHCGKCIILNRADIYIRWIKNYPKIKRILWEHGPYAAVHCHNDIESGYILKAAQRCGVPVRISHVHRIIGQFSGIRVLPQILWTNQARKYTNLRVGCSKEACRGFFGTAVENIVIANPYNEKTYHYYKENNNDTDVYPFNIVQIGYYCENKNQMFSIEVLSKIKKVFPEVALFLVGFEAEEDIKGKLQKRARELGGSENVIFLPHDADKAALLREAAYLLFPSYHEGFGLVLIEAQAMGVRCFASDAVLRETDCGGVTYLPLSLGAEKWAEIIMEDYEQTKGAHGDFDCSRFASENVAKQFAEIYEGKNLT